MDLLLVFMNIKELVDFSITLCQSSRLGLSALIRESMNPLVLKSMGLTHPEDEMKLPYPSVEKDPPVIATLKQTLNHLYYSEKQLQSLLGVLSTDFSKIQSKAKLLKFLLGAMDMVDNATKLAESFGGVGRIADDFSRQGAEVARHGTEVVRLKLEDFRKMNLDLSSLRQQAQSQLEQLRLTASSTEGLVEYAKNLKKIFPEKLDRFTEEMGEIGHSLLFDSDNASKLIARNWVLLRGLELEGGLKPGVFTEPYVQKLFDLIPKDLNKERDGVLRDMIGRSITDGYDQSKKQAESHIKFAYEAQINELIARQFFSLVERLPSSWDELRKSSVRGDKKFQMLLNCYAQLRSELAPMNPDLDHVFMTLIQDGGLSEHAKTWNLHDFLSYKESLIKQYQSAAKGSLFSYQSYQDSLSQSERDTPAKKLLTKIQLHDEAKARLDKKYSKEDLMPKDPAYIPAPKPVTCVEDRHKIAAVIIGIQKQREILLKSVPDLSSESLPYVSRRNDKALIKTTKSAMNMLYYSEKLLTTHHQALIESNQSGVKASIKFLFYRLKRAFLAKKMAGAMVDLTHTLDKEGSACVSDVCSAAIKLATEKLTALSQKHTIGNFQKIKQLVLDIRRHGDNNPGPSEVESQSADSFHEQA